MWWRAARAVRGVVWGVWGGERAVLGARDGRGGGGWPKSRPPRARPCAPAYERELFGGARERKGLFSDGFFGTETGGVGLHGLRCGGFDATPGGSRVRGVCAFEYDCNPAAPPSGPGSLAGREAAARTALRKTHIERTTHHTHHAPRTHPPLSKRLLCPAKRVALSLPRRTHARRAKSRRSRAAGGVGREPPEREARSTSGFRG